MYDSLSNSICSISVKTKDNDYSRYGTGFLFTDSYILSALHVLIDRENESIDDITEIVLTSNSGVMDTGTVEVIREVEDLVVLKTNLVSKLQPVEVSGDIPDIGTKCLWLGYPRLIGERSTRRVRYGWGKVSSKPPETNSGIFEIDGNFSPGHSGAPVFNEKTDSVIGVVSRSVGDPREHFKRFRRYVEALEFIAPLLKLPSELLKSIREMMGPRRIDLPDDAFSFTVEGEVPKDADGITMSVIRTLEEVGVDVRKYSYFNLRALDDETQPKSVKALDIYGFDSLMRGAINLILQISNSVESAVNDTYQMGIGIASGGKPLIDLYNSLM